MNLKVDDYFLFHLGSRKNPMVFWFELIFLLFAPLCVDVITSMYIMNGYVFWFDAAKSILDI